MLNHVGALRDVIYDLHSDETQWIDQLAQAFVPLMPDASRVAIGALRLHGGGATLENVGPNTPAIRAFLSLAAKVLPAAQLHEIMQRAPSTGSFTEWIEPLGVPNFWANFSAAGLKIRDFVGLRALDGGDRFLTVSAWYDEEQRTSASLRNILEPVASHIATMFRLRRSLRGQELRPEHGSAVLEVDGRITHAQDDATPADARALLREQVARIENAKTRAGIRDGRLWQPLVDGRWTLIDRYDTDGRRLYVAVKNMPDFESNHALSTREQQVARMAGQGLANKEIAYALGLSLSSISTYLHRALDKLRLQSRAELPLVFEQSARRMELQGSSLLVAEQRFRVPTGLTHAEEEVALMAVRGLSDQDIARRRSRSVRTIANLLRSTYKKLSVSNRSELIRVFMRR